MNKSKYFLYIENDEHNKALELLTIAITEVTTFKELDLMSKIIRKTVIKHAHSLSGLELTQLLSHTSIAIQLINNKLLSLTTN